MSKVAGQLLWNRIKTDNIVGETDYRCNTGLCQKSMAEDPDFASRVMVIPQAPLSAWADVSIGEPFMTNGVVHVDFSYDGQAEAVILNVLFWAPHTVAGPVDVDLYNPQV